MPDPRTAGLLQIVVGPRFAKATAYPSWRVRPRLRLVYWEAVSPAPAHQAPRGSTPVSTSLPEPSPDQQHR